MHLFPALRSGEQEDQEVKASFDFMVVHYSSLKFTYGWRSADYLFGVNPLLYLALSGTSLVALPVCWGYRYGAPHLAFCN